MNRPEASPGDATPSSVDGATLGAPALRNWLLSDADGDGFADALRYPVWLASGTATTDVDAAVASAAELLSVLAARALHLAVDVRVWPSDRPGFYIGRAPPEASPAAPDDDGSGHVLHATEAARLSWSEDGFLAQADDAAALYPAFRRGRDCRSFVRQPKSDCR